MGECRSCGKELLCGECATALQDLYKTTTEEEAVEIFCSTNHPSPKLAKLDRKRNVTRKLSVPVKVKQQEVKKGEAQHDDDFLSLSPELIIPSLPTKQKNSGTKKRRRSSNTTKKKKSNGRSSIDNKRTDKRTEVRIRKRITPILSNNKLKISPKKKTSVSGTIDTRNDLSKLTQKSTHKIPLA